jgi:hypothetical protein
VGSVSLVTNTVFIVRNSVCVFMYDEPPTVSGRGFVTNLFLSLGRNLKRHSDPKGGDDNRNTTCRLNHVRASYDSQEPAVKKA